MLPLNFQTLVAAYMPLFFGVLLIVHGAAHTFGWTFSIGRSSMRFGPGTDLQDMTTNLLMVTGLFPFQVLSSYERAENRTLWARLGAAMICAGLLLAALEKVAGTQWRDQAALVLLPGGTILAFVSCFIAVMLFSGKTATRRKAQAVNRRVVGLLRGSRNVIPVFLAGFLLTIFSPDITEAVAAVPGETIQFLSLAAIVVTAALHERGDHPYGERLIAMAGLWSLLALSVLLLDVYLIANEQLLDWGASTWAGCSVTDPSTGCVEAVLIPRLKIAGLLGALGTVSVMAQSLVPPIPRSES